MNPVNSDMADRYYSASKEGVDAVLDRMVQSIGNPGGSYAMALDVSENTIKTWRRRGQVSLKYLEGFARTHGVALDYLLGREVQNEPAGTPASAKPESDGETKVGKQGKHLADDFVMVPRYEVRASAGHGAVIHSEQIVDYLAFRADWIHTALGVAQKDLALIEVHGDSMEPTLSNGDLILLDMRHGKVMDNSVYAIQLNGGLLVKRIQRKLNGSIIVKSDNPRYEPESLDPTEADQLRVVGRVVWAGRRM